MFVQNPILTVVLIFIGVIFFAVIAFWLVFAVKKFKWAMIVSIVVSSIFVLTLGLAGIRMLAGRTVAVVESRQYSISEKAEDIKDLRKYEKIRPFSRLERLKSKRPLHGLFRDLEEENIEELKEKWDQIESITIKDGEVTIKMKE